MDKETLKEEIEALGGIVTYENGYNAYSDSNGLIRGECVEAQFDVEEYDEVAVPNIREGTSWWFTSDWDTKDDDKKGVLFERDLH